MRSDEADRVDHPSGWPDNLLVPDVEGDDELASLLTDAKAAAKSGAEWFAEEFRRREAEEEQAPVFPPRETPAPVDAEVAAQAIDD